MFPFQLEIKNWCAVQRIYALECYGGPVYGNHIDDGCTDEIGTARTAACEYARYGAGSTFLDLQAVVRTLVEDEKHQEFHARLDAEQAVCVFWQDLQGSRDITTLRVEFRRAIAVWKRGMNVADRLELERFHRLPPLDSRMNFQSAWICDTL